MSSQHPNCVLEQPPISVGTIRVLFGQLKQEISIQEVVLSAQHPKRVLTHPPMGAGEEMFTGSAKAPTKKKLKRKAILAVETNILIYIPRDGLF